MKKIIISTIFILASCGFAFAQTPHDAIKKVKEIKLLESTRDDVQRLLINYESDDYDFEEHSQEFFSDFADIEVSYSSGKCQENVAGEEDEDGDDVAEIWNVVEWKATKTVINFDEAVKIEDAGFNLSEFKKQKRFPTDDDNDNSNNDEDADDEGSDSFIYHSKNLGVALIGNAKEIEKIIFYPSKGNHSKLCDNKKAKKFASAENWFGTAELEIGCKLANNFADVTDLVLSAEEVYVTDCAGKTQNKKRHEKVNKISVQTVAVDAENDVMNYDYKISGGKIVGQGANVVWNLTGVQPGTYTITAGVDDGAGINGQTKTQTVVVRQCPNSKRK